MLNVSFKVFCADVGAFAIGDLFEYGDAMFFHVVDVGRAVEDEVDA